MFAGDLFLMLRALPKISGFIKSPWTPKNDGWFSNSLPAVGDKIRNILRLIRRAFAKAIPLLLTVGASVLLAHGILNSSPTKMVVAVSALLFGFFFARRVEYGIVAVLIVAASVIYPAAVPKPLTIGGQGLHFTELLITFLVVVVSIQSLAHKRLEIFSSPITVPLLLLFMSVLISFIVKYHSYVVNHEGLFPWREVYNIARPMFHYVLFFVVAFGLRSERQLRFVIVTLTIATMIVSLLMVAQYIVGPNVRLFFAPKWAESSVRVESLSMDEQDVTRSLPPGLYAIPFVLITTLVLACTEKKRARWFYGIACIASGTGLLFSFTRNLWVLTCMAIISVWLLSKWDVRRRLSVFLAIIFCVIIFGSIGLLEVFGGKSAENFSKAIVNRFTSSFVGLKVNSSLQDRAKENASAIRLIKSDPILGVGLGTPLVYKQWTRPGRNTKVIFPWIEIHNSYLELWAVYGILGLVSFLWISVAFSIRCFIVFRRARDAFHRAIALGMLSSQIIYMLTATVAMTYLHHTSAICITAAMWGIIEVIWRLEKESSEKIAAENSSLDVQTVPKLSASL